MGSWIAGMFRFVRKESADCTVDPVDFDSTLIAARSMSLRPQNRSDVVVVVELEMTFNSATGVYDDRRYNFYTHRGSGNFNDITNLKAAFCNGKRVDGIDRAVSSRPAVHKSDKYPGRPG